MLTGHAMMTYKRRRGIAPSIPNFGTGDEWSDSHPGNFTPRTPPPPIAIK